MTPVATTAARRPLGVRLLPEVWHYGWWIALGIAVVMFATVGVGFYGLAVFLAPLQDENGWSNAAVSGATGLYFSLSGLTGFLVGPLVDRRGPLRPMAIGITLVGLSAMALARVDELWQLYLVYSVQAVAFGLAGQVATNAIIARWFVTKRAKAISISATGVSLGGVVLAPLGTWLIGRGGVSLAALVMGVLVIVIALPIVATVLVWDPAQVDLEVDGGAANPGVANASLADEVQQRVWTRTEAARTVAFWAVLAAFLLGLAAQTGFLLHQIAFLTERFGSANRAAFALSITAFGSIVARIALGQVADRLDKRVLTAGLFGLQGAAILGLLAIDGIAVTYALVMVVGFTIGNVYMMQTLLVGELFGMVSLATVFGVIGLAVQVGSGLGPLLVGLIEDRTGSYDAAFAVSACVLFAAAVTVLAARAPAAAEATEEARSGHPASEAGR
ncbi:MAG: MFS transporter [Actinomycetota bacterium]